MGKGTRPGNGMKKQSIPSAGLGRVPCTLNECPYNDTIQGIENSLGLLFQLHEKTDTTLTKLTLLAEKTHEAVGALSEVIGAKEKE